MFERAVQAELLEERAEWLRRLAALKASHDLQQLQRPMENPCCSSCNPCGESRLQL